MNIPVRVIFFCQILLLSVAAGAVAEPLTLGTAHELALRQAPQLRVRRLQMQARQELPRQATAQLLPQVSASSAYAYNNYSVSYRVDPIEEKIRYNSVNVFQPLLRPDLWQKVGYATLQAEAARLQLQLDEQELSARVVAAYFEVLHRRKGVELAEERLAAYRGRHEKIEGYLARGLANKVDALEAAVKHDQTRADLMEATSQLRLAMMTLGHLIGLSNPELPELGAMLPPPVTEPAAYEAWVGKLDANLAVRLARVGLAMARSDAKIRRYERFPKLDARLSYSDSDSTELTTRTDDFRALLEINLPIFRGGYDSSREEEARLQAEAAREEVEFKLKEEAEKLEKAWADYGLAGDRIRALRQSLDSARLYLATAEKAHQAGLQDLIRVLEARAKVPEVEQQLIKAGYDMIFAYFNLKSAVGEMTAETIQELSRLLPNN